MTKKINIGQSSKVEIQWNVKPVDYSVEKADEIRSKMAIKYGIPKRNIHINPNFIKKNAKGETEVATSDISKNIQDPKFQQELFKKFLEENNITDYNFDAILNIDNMINSIIDYSVYDKYRRYRIEWVRWSNFLSYGENNFIDFNDLSGLVLLKSDPANQGGKTNFACDLIKFLLFGSGDAGKSDVLKNIFNKHLPDATEVKVEGGLEIEGEHYVIRRTVTRPQKKKRTEKSVVTQKVEYFRVVDGTEIALENVDNLEAESNTKTNQAIKEAIGDKNDFNLVVLANSDNLKALISMKDKERGQLLTRWIGLAPLEKKFQEANDKWLHEIKPALLTVNYNKEDLRNYVSTAKNDIESLTLQIKDLNNKLSDSTNRIVGYNKEKEDLFGLKQFVDASLSNVDITTLLAKQKRVMEDGMKYKQLIENIEKEINEIGEVLFSNEEYETLNEIKIAITNDIASIKTEMKILAVDIDKHTNSEYCPTCKRKLDNVDNSQIISDLKKKYTKLFNDGVAKNDKFIEVENKIKSLKDNKLKFDTKNAKLIKKSTLEVELVKKREEYRDITVMIKTLNQSKEAIEHNNKIDTKINVLNENIRTEEQIKYRLITEIEGYKNEIAVLTKQISERELIISKLIEEEVIIKAWEHYLLMVGKNGISKMVLRQTLPIINAELNNLLYDVCDFNILVDIDDTNHINFSIIADGVKSNLLSGSGFEQTVSALALRAVLGNISTLPRPSFMLLDEVLGGVARENYDNVKKLYDKILKDYSFIFQITHLDDIADWHNTTVVVKKEKRISTISVLK